MVPTSTSISEAVKLTLPKAEFEEVSLFLLGEDLAEDQDFYLSRESVCAKSSLLDYSLNISWRETVF